MSDPNKVLYYFKLDPDNEAIFTEYSMKVLELDTEQSIAILNEAEKVAEQQGQKPLGFENDEIKKIILVVNYFDNDKATDNVPFVVHAIYHLKNGSYDNLKLPANEAKQSELLRNKKDIRYYLSLQLNEFLHDVGDHSSCRKRHFIQHDTQEF